MSVLKNLFVSLAVGATAALTLTPAVAQERHNWMREYVQLRVHARLARAIGAEAAAEVAAAQQQSRIVGGTVALAGSNPFQVGLLFKSEPDNFFAQYCGGTLYKQKYVITAAHCSDFITAATVQVLTNTRKLDGTGVRRNVLSVKIHPSYNADTFNNDVAVWKLSTNGPLFTVGLATADPALGTSLLATGWGSTGSGFPIELRQVKVPLFSRTNCNDANSYNGSITTAMLCAGFNAGGKDTCQGDSGGPLTQDPAGDGVIRFNRLVGITSWGNGCALANFPGVYTRVSNTSIRNFIVANTP